MNMTPRPGPSFWHWALLVTCIVYIVALAWMGI
jgi:hypothetical protein